MAKNGVELMVMMMMGSATGDRVHSEENHVRMQESRVTRSRSQIINDEKGSIRVDEKKCDERMSTLHRAGVVSQ